MDKGYVATSSIVVNASPVKVWEALTNPELVKKYVFGTELITDWKEGNPIVWRGEWQGRPYEDKGTVLTFQPEKKLVVTHYSPLSGVEDSPENYHMLSYEILPEGEMTKLILTQYNNATAEEKEHSEKNWQMFLEGLKKIVE